MTKLKIIIHGLLLTVMLAFGASPRLVAAQMSVPTAPTPAAPIGLALTQIKITGDEFVTIQNNSLSDIPDLSVYTLKSFNNVNPLASGAASSTQQLPPIGLATGQRLLLSAAPRNTCAAAVAGKLSLSLLDSGGFLQIMQSNGTATTTLIDSVSWSTATSGIIPAVPSSTKDPQAVYYRYASGIAYSWQLADQDPANTCRLTISVMNANGAPTSIILPTDAATPIDVAPATIITNGSEPDIEPGISNLPPADSGLTVPEITELLPNPAGRGNDARDEFIELYNPNDADFDLSGFKLQTGTTSTRTYTFSSGALLLAKSFASYSSATTGLSLSNAGGRAQLLDPSANVLVTTPAYGTASDGQSWALARGHWYWSLTPTPGVANVITLPALPINLMSTSSPNAALAPAKSSKAAASIKTSKSLTATTVKQPKIAKAAPPKTNKKKAATSKPIATTPTAANVTARPVQAKVVALVAGLAVLYGAYEYRADLANGFFKLRSKLSFGRPDRS